MADKGEQTRERILAVAEPLILQQGFAGTSLDDIVARTGLTKGAFFHHFKGKGHLARALVERYARNDYELFEGFLQKAEAESDDPLEQTLLFLKGFEQFVQQQAAPLAGCVFAAYTYEALQFDSAIHRFIGESFDRWSGLYEAKFAAILARQKPRRPASARDLAQMITSIIEGGFILSRIHNDAALVARQSKQFRQYLELLFDAAEKPAERKRGKR
jgi:TetR/AcrR family transcriptional regulator, transcriptional repressor for nem operon